MNTTQIKCFDGDWRWLSNFYPCEVVLDWEIYPTVEHAYQAAKTFDPIKRGAIRTAPTPNAAKKLGQKVQLIPNWEEIKLQVMEDLLRQKFNKQPFRNQLINTQDAHLEEGNWWGDKFWGTCRGEGQNHLGKLLMKIRSDLQQ